jgi:hypothetical protein
MKNLIVILAVTLITVVSNAAEARDFKKSNDVHFRTKYKSQRKWMPRSCFLNKGLSGNRGKGVLFR